MSPSVNQLLQPFQRFGVHLGLVRIQTLLHQLGNPQHRVPIIHVAGSNGKGSVCAYLSAVLTAAGYRVGRYTSPHLIDWNERIVVNEQAIAPAEFQALLAQVEAAIDPDQESPTQFELITAAAWLHFAQQQVDIAVMEVGLGGRLDATNVCDRPLVTIITSISREHWQVLGNTVAEIAGEKAGILKPGCPAVIGGLPPEAEAVVKTRIAELGCPALWPEPAQIIAPPTPDSRYGWGRSQGIDYPLPLAGTAQLSNSALAIAALTLLRQQGWQIGDTAIQQGMANTRWPGRLQWITWQAQPLLVDGAHNPASAVVLRDYVDSVLGDRALTADPASPSVVWVMGMLSTKDHGEILRALLRSGDALYLVPVPDHSTADPQELANLAQSICPTLSHCQPYPDLLTALTAANRDRPNGIRVLCGSLYLIGQVLGGEKVDSG